MLIITFIVIIMLYSPFYIKKVLYLKLHRQLQLKHPSLERISMQWVCAQESRQQPVLLDSKPDKMTVAILNVYGTFLSYSTQ